MPVTLEELMENCDECVSETEYRIEEKVKRKRQEKREEADLNTESWLWMIERVKKGPVSDMICLIPRIRQYDLFGDIFRPIMRKYQRDYLILFNMILKYGELDLSIYFSKAIKAGNLPKYIKLAKRSGNEEICEYLKSLIADSKDTKKLEDNENFSGGFQGFAAEEYYSMEFP